MNFKKSFLLAFLFFNIVSMVSAQEELLIKTKTAFKTANAKILVENFNNIVEISFDGERSQYNKIQSEIVMNDFFKKHPYKDFVIKHQGTSKDEGIKYAIGSYTYNGGEYRVYILIKMFKGFYLIDTVDFSKE
jgi:hypothetical protein